MGIHVGVVFDDHFKLLTQLGRKSGKVRRTVLAVLEYDQDTREIKAMSAWSASDWYLNTKANPALQVETGFTRYAPIQRSLSSADEPV